MESRYSGKAKSQFIEEYDKLKHSLFKIKILVYFYLKYTRV